LGEAPNGFKRPGRSTGGTAILNLRRSVGPTATQLNEGNFALNPAPSDAAGDALDGTLRILAPTKRNLHPLRLPKR
jgi:hypothetical protein